jgi:cobalt-zinc-cadmium efflux system outer membrane protein
MDADEPTGVLTLRQATAFALARNPELAALSREVRAREGAVVQAAARPNPFLETSVEDFAGTGLARGFSASQTTVQVGQLFELGGKRPARTRAAARGVDLGRREYDARRNAIRGQVAETFVDVLTAQERQVLTADVVRLAERVTSTVTERVRAGKVAPIEETRARAALASTRLDLDRVRRELEAARRRLAATWGSDDPHFDAVEGTLDVSITVPSREQLAARLSQNPELARWDAEVLQRRAALEVEESKRVPDVALSGGPRWLNLTGDVAFVLFATVPLPIYTRNEGAIEEARHRIARAEHERSVASVRLTTALAGTYRALSTAAAEVATLKADVLPAAQEAFEAVSEGYRFGKFGLVDVLEAQRTFFDARGRLLRALSEYQKALVVVERLIDAPLAAG